MNGRIQTNFRILLVFVLIVSVTAVLGQDIFESNFKLERSDVVATTHHLDREKVDAYGVTIVSVEASTGMREDELDFYRSEVQYCHEKGIKIFSGLFFVSHYLSAFDILVHDPGLHKAACLDLFDNPIVCTHLSDYLQEGIPLWRFCHNNDRFKEYIRNRLYLVMEAGFDGIMVDEWWGSGRTVRIDGGCYCDYCMKGFNKYLEAKYSPEELADHGISDINEFDYQALGKEYANSPATYITAVNTGEVPLIWDFEEFQYSSAADFIGELKKYAIRLKGEYVPFALNNVKPEFPLTLLSLEHIDFLQRETAVKAKEETIVPYTVFFYETMKSLGKPVAAHILPPDWYHVKKHNRTGLVRLWTAFTYASGQHLFAPFKTWSKTQNIDDPTMTSWYFPPLEEYAPAFQFVRQNSSLFDGMTDIQKVGVCVNAQDPKNMKFVENICYALKQEQVPFRMIIHPDQIRTGKDYTAQYIDLDVVIVPEDLLSGQPDIEDYFKEIAGGQNGFTWNKNSSIVEVLPRINKVIEVNQEGVWTFPKREESGNASQFVCHLLNQDYNGEANSMEIKDDLEVRFKTRELGIGKVKSVSYTAYGEEEADFSYDVSNEELILKVPALDLWGILKIETK